MDALRCRPQIYCRFSKDETQNKCYVSFVLVVRLFDRLFLYFPFRLMFEELYELKTHEILCSQFGLLIADFRFSAACLDDG